MRAIGEGLTCLMIDLDLPGVNGFDLISQMRKNFPDLPIIAVSGVYQATALESAKALGAAAVLSKPVTAEWRAVVDRVRRTTLN
jgi:CheY-like chemotaxis protein